MKMPAGERGGPVRADDAGHGGQVGALAEAVELADGGDLGDGGLEVEEAADPLLASIDEAHVFGKCGLLGALNGARQRLQGGLLDEDGRAEPFQGVHSARKVEVLLQLDRFTPVVQRVLPVPDPPGASVLHIREGHSAGLQHPEEQEQGDRQKYEAESAEQARRPAERGLAQIAQR
ncbi:hypothetical protein AB0J83_44720 [Actinoplanes sp. NPDC049596]|uniref:hypothetical protein n=1 Tax=unclassified Actinoplanes TaxID=2626549 RepID=UPI0034276B22